MYRKFAIFRKIIMLTFGNDFKLNGNQVFYGQG